MVYKDLTLFMRVKLHKLNENMLLFVKKNWKKVIKNSICQIKLKLNKSYIIKSNC